MVRWTDQIDWMHTFSFSANDVVIIIIFLMLDINFYHQHPIATTKMTVLE